MRLLGERLTLNPTSRGECLAPVLEERGLVRHREPYWAIGDLEKVRDAMMFSSTAEFLDEALGTESRENWLDAAQEGEESRE